MEHTQTIDTASQESFEEAVQTYISWAAEWDGSLPADTFFGVWADLQKEKDKAPLALKARIVEGRLELMAPPHSGVKATDNRIYLENGLELVIDLEPAA
jgi:hypothetical protein